MQKHLLAAERADTSRTAEETDPGEELAVRGCAANGLEDLKMAPCPEGEDMFLGPLPKMAKKPAHLEDG